MEHPKDRFPAHERVDVEIGKTPYARFDLNDYSVPHDRTRRTVTVIADSATVRIVDNNEQIAIHARSWSRGDQVETPEHIERLTAEKKRARQHRGFDRLAKATPSSQAFLRLVAERGENLGSVTARLLELLDTAGAEELEEALVEALERGTLHVGALRQVIDRRRSGRGLPPPTTIPIAAEHRDLVVTPHALATYDTLHGENS